MRVLIIEDERAMAALLKKGLEEENHTVTLVFDGRDGLEIAEHYEFDVLVLDLMLPGMSGFDVARRLRRNRNATPILILTARDAPAHIVRGLDLGADDYLTKPFSFEIFLARLRAIARRGAAPRPAYLEVGDLRLDPAAHNVFRGGKAIRLSPTEFRLLEFLMRRAGRVATREAIVEAVWGFGQEIESNTLDAFVRLLRDKMDRGFARKVIHTVRGVGYVMRDESAS